MPIDLNTFRELEAAAGAEFVAELVDTFAEEAPGLLAELSAALAADDAAGFRRAAHSLKSNSLTFGALALAGQARTLELAGPQVDRAQDAAALDALATALAEALAALQGLRHG